MVMTLYLPLLIKTSDGECVYISNKLSFQVIKRNWHENEKCKDIWLSVHDSISKCNFNIIVLYRHPNTSKPKFIDTLEEALENALLSNSITYLLGDMNLDINKHNCTDLAQSYMYVLNTKGFFPVITKPTRVTHTSATIIDHILTNNTTQPLIPGIVRTDEISDHYFTFVSTLTTNKIKQNTKSKVRRRDEKLFFYRI